MAVRSLRLFKRVPPKQGDRLAQCIRIEDGKFFFYINPLVLTEIQAAIARSESLYLPLRLLAQMRQLIFFDVVVVDGEQYEYSQSGLTFCTYYVDLPGEEQLEPELGRVRGIGNIILRTVLSLDGDTIHQIRHDLLPNPHCIELVKAHHWLIIQVLGNLRRRTTKAANRLAWAIAIAVVWIPVIISIATDPTNAPQVIVSTILGIVLPYPLHEIIKRVLRWISPWIRRWVVWKLLTSDDWFMGKLVKRIRGFAS